MPHFSTWDGLRGSVTTPGYEGSIEVSSFEWDVEDDGSRKSNRKKKIVLSKPVDQASPLLFQSFDGGNVHATVVLQATEADASGQEQTYYKIVMQDVTISCLSAAGDGGSLPIELISMNFAKCEVHYTPQR